MIARRSLHLKAIQMADYADNEIHRLSVHELSRLLANKKISAGEIVHSLIQRIEKYNQVFHPFITTTFELALSQAKDSDERRFNARSLGPLDGIPIALKDAYDTRGIKTTVGSGLFRDRVPEEDCEVWRRLASAGAILMGKLECTEFCLGGPSKDAHFPMSLNPHDKSRYTGGSSSGAGVALATGMIPAAIGSDTGGSIRIPASFCGVAGIKPTYGLVSLRGLFPLSGSLDHAGPMARTSRDCAILLDEITGHDRRHPTSSTRSIAPTSPTLSKDCEGLVIGLVANFTDIDAVTEASRNACLRAMDVFVSLGAKIKRVELPDLWDYTIANTTIMSAEAYALHHERFKSSLEKISDLTRHRIALGAFLSATDYITAQKARRTLTQKTFEIMNQEQVDVLCYPGMLDDPPEVDKVTRYYYLNSPLITAPANLTGAPCASVRVGYSATNMPMSIQIMGRPFDDGKVLSAAHAYETATPDFSKIVEI